MAGYQTLEVKGAYTKVPWDDSLTHTLMIFILHGKITALSVID